MFPIRALYNAFISILHKFNSWCTQYYKNPFIVNSPQYYLPLIYGCLSPCNTTSSFQLKTKMASPQNWFNEVPSFDLGIDSNSEISDNTWVTKILVTLVTLTNHNVTCSFFLSPSHGL